jgi:hypothetical protein
MHCRRQRHWYHLQFARIADTITVACLCPKGLGCVHEQFFKDFQQERFPNDGTFSIAGEWQC